MKLLLNISAAEISDHLGRLSVELSYSAHILDIIEVIAGEDLSQRDSADNFLRRRNEISALARAVATMVQTSEARIVAIQEVLPHDLSTRLKGAEHAA